MNRVSLVTGTESALGTTLADYLYRAGHQVYRLDTSRFFGEVAGGPSAEASAEPRHEEAEASVSDYVTHVVNREGRLDAVVNVASYGLAGVVESATAGEVHDLYAHNLLLPHVATRAALSVMEVQGHGAVINVGLFPHADAEPGHGLYSTSLNSLLAYTETLRQELGPKGISVRFVQARSQGGVYGAGVRWSRLLSLPSLRAVRQAVSLLVGAETPRQAQVQLAHLIEQMIRDPRPVPSTLPGHALPPILREQVLARDASGHGESFDADAAASAPPTPSTDDSATKAASSLGVSEGAPFAPPWATFIGAWTEHERRYVAKALRGYEAEVDVPVLFAPYWVCSKGNEPVTVSAHRAGSTLLFSAPDIRGLVHRLRQSGAHPPERPF